MFEIIQLSLFTSHSLMCDTGHVKFSLQAIPRLLKTWLTIHI